MRETRGRSVAQDLLLMTNRSLHLVRWRPGSDQHTHSSGSTFLICFQFHFLFPAFFIPPNTTASLLRYRWHVLHIIFQGKILIYLLCGYKCLPWFQMAHTHRHTHMHTHARTQTHTNNGNLFHIISISTGPDWKFFQVGRFWECVWRMAGLSSLIQPQSPIRLGQVRLLKPAVTHTHPQSIINLGFQQKQATNNTTHFCNHISPESTNF